VDHEKINYTLVTILTEGKKMMKTYAANQSVSKGFSLIELMIVIVIVAFLATMAIPNYTSYIRKANRTSAITQLLKAQSSFEAQYTANNPPTYPTGSTTPAAASIMSAYNDTHYIYTAVSTSTSYTLTATAQGSQAQDMENGISCTPLTISNTNVQSPAACWN